jgi:hypothetical protein
MCEGPSGGGTWGVGRTKKDQFAEEERRTESRAK